MKTLILVRHGESAWNKLNLFTGWTDVDLTEAGIKEAYEAGKLLKAEGYRPAASPPTSNVPSRPSTRFSTPWTWTGCPCRKAGA